MKFLYYFIFSVILIIDLLFFRTIFAKSLPPLAILSEIKGDVLAGPKNKLTKGFNSKLLFKNYNIITADNSFTSIFFVDGSEIRLFEKSNIKIGVKKSPSKKWVRYRILLKSGSFWGNFTRGKNPIEISNKGFYIHLSNTSIRITKTENGLNISTTSGIAKVYNKVSSTKLISGQRLFKVQNKDVLPQKISTIPNQLKLWIEPKNLIFSKKESLLADLFIQVVRYGTNTKIKRTGPVFLRSNYYNIFLPNSIILDKDGTSKTKIEIKSPHITDRTFAGTIIFQALMDQNGYDDVLDGSLKTKLKSFELIN